MLGIGDNIHIRAAVREWAKTHFVHIEAPQVTLFHDFIAAGEAAVYLRDTNLHAQKRQLERERHLFTPGRPPPQAVRRLIGYNKPEVDRWGTITRAVVGQAGLEPPEKPDFSLPVPEAWRTKARDLVALWDIGGKPFLIYRPITLRQEWDSAHRNADPDAYAAIFASIRERFFVVSIADLAHHKETIVGTEQEADIKLHQGELDFETMAALFKRADLIFSPAGFAPVLAQAVGTASIPIYGRRESFATTEVGGAHLAPTLGIDPDETCDCHSLAHRCTQCRPAKSPKKHITLPPAIEKVRMFVDQQLEAQ